MPIIQQLSLSLKTPVWTLPVMPELSFSKACFPFAHYSSIMLGSAKGGLQGD